MRLIFINRFFYPDESATALMLTDLVVGLSPIGLEIHVITTAASYTPEADGSQLSLFGGDVSVTRLPNLPISHQSLAGRALNFIVFYCGLIFAGLHHIRQGDIVICLTDPPLVGIFAALLARFKGARLIHWVQDIYPETAMRLGIGSPSNPVIRWVIRLRDWAWKHADKNVIIGERMAQMLQSRGVFQRQLCVIQNWAEDDVLLPLSPEDNSLRAQWGFSQTDIVVGYSGNLGRAHDAATMLEAAALLSVRQAETVRFLFIGGGAKHADLETAAKEARLASVVAQRPYRPRAELRQSLSVPDIHWLSLEPELEGLIVPSKFYGAAAVGRPIVYIGDIEGEVARLIRKADCGSSFAKGDAQGVADFVSRLAGDLALRQRLGKNARTYSVGQLSRVDRIAQWRSVIEEAVSKNIVGTD
ncbi:glycosyltransferase [Porphyrobacter sp. SLTP]|uniref:glycosyltransferase family 4 protein n=1 Tax=Porphyrobacter sp. SLTP TaxID=2683266 RepID=UPI001411BC12|nr:glycosyltransferase family 4 protein [Porphyrobacter sp. SLTP]NBB23618.1 glycosyltransferase [Porphyrobacter sp. SLTP]